MSENKTVKVVKKEAKKGPKKATKLTEYDVYAQLFNFKKTDMLLDLGCGGGELLKSAATKVKNAIGIDCSAEALSKAQQLLSKNKNIALLEGYMQDWDFEPESFSKISLYNSIRNLNNHEKGILIHRANSWLKPGGLIIIKDLITSFALHRKDERCDLVEAECKAYYGKKWGDAREKLLHDLYRKHPGDYSLMMHHFLFTGFNVLQVIKHTSCECTIIAQK